MAVEKVNVTIPKETMDRLRRLVPAGERSRVIAAATQQFLDEMLQQETLRKVAGLWKDRRDLQSQSDVNRMLQRIRGSTRRRLGGLRHRD